MADYDICFIQKCDGLTVKIKHHFVGHRLPSLIFKVEIWYNTRDVINQILKPKFLELYPSMAELTRTPESEIKKSMSNIICEHQNCFSIFKCSDIISNFKLSLDDYGQLCCMAVDVNNTNFELRLVDMTELDYKTKLPDIQNVVFQFLLLHEKEDFDLNLYYILRNEIDNKCQKTY